MTDLRDVLAELLDGRSAHVDFDRAVKGMPFGEVGVRPAGVEHSVWELVEHLRIAAEDIVEFSRGPHESPPWPDGYWPAEAAPGGEDEWEASLAAYRDWVEAMREMVTNRERELLEPFEWGDGQTLAREAMLLADHAGYHLGQIVFVRRLLGCWPPA
jgi:hypothetical protein